MSWTVSYFRRYRRLFGLVSLLQLRKALIQVHQGAVAFDRRLTLCLKSPSSVSLTIRPATNDVHTLDEVFIDTVYEPLLRGVESCKTIVDLGANIGLTSLYLHLRFPEATIVAVEPDGENFALLKHNLAPLMEEGKCRAVHGAVWGRREMLSLSGGDEAYHVNGRQYSAGEGSDPESARTQGYTVAEILAAAGFETLDLLKMDIEGGETSVFRGDTGWLARVQRLVVEFHGNSRAESGFDALLERYGLHVEDENDHTVVAVRIENR